MHVIGVRIEYFIHVFGVGQKNDFGRQVTDSQITNDTLLARHSSADSDPYRRQITCFRLLKYELN